MRNLIELTSIYLIEIVTRNNNQQESQTDTYEPPHDKTNKMTCAPSEDSDQPGHLPNLIRGFAVHWTGS